MKLRIREGLLKRVAWVALRLLGFSEMQEGSPKGEVRFHLALFQHGSNSGFFRDFSVNPTISELPGPGWLEAETEARPSDLAVCCHHVRELMADDSLESLLFSTGHRLENVHRGLLEAVSGNRLVTRPTAPTVGIPVPDRWSLACRPAVAPTGASGVRRPTRHAPRLLG